MNLSVICWTFPSRWDTAHSTSGANFALHCESGGAYWSRSNNNSDVHHSQKQNCSVRIYCYEDNGKWQFDGTKEKEIVLLTILYLIRKSSLALSQNFHFVLLADCTYKTNRFRIPLFVVGGKVFDNKTFTLAYRFMDSETENDYHWTLQQLRETTNKIPDVFVTDRELALINALKTEYPATTHMLLNVKKTSTQRESSEFEQRSSSNNTCSLCKRPGHNRRSCKRREYRNTITII
ncbi:hypothetical protein RCL1_007998 [Eukaryota sp. TZLM3-RCL]